MHFIETETSSMLYKLPIGNPFLDLNNAIVIYIKTESML